MSDAQPDDSDSEARRQTTWAGRNPLINVQSSRHRTTLSTAERNTRNLQAAGRKIKAAQLALDIDALHLKRAEDIEALALKHHQKPARILDIFNHSTHYKKSRLPTLQNALAHHKSV